MHSEDAQRALDAAAIPAIGSRERESQHRRSGPSASRRFAPAHQRAICQRGKALTSFSHFEIRRLRSALAPYFA